jgi:chromosome segregation ATPase
MSFAPSQPSSRLQEAATKLRAEREAACRDVAVLRTDLDSTRGDRERLTQELKEAREELDRWGRGWGGG